MNDMINVPRELLEKLAPELPYTESNDWGTKCVYCSNDVNSCKSDKRISHEEDCPWILARILMGDYRYNNIPKEIPGIKIVVTAQQVLDLGIDQWRKFCDSQGISEWTIADGRMSSMETFTITEKEARTLGIIN